jgi:hypothetical protein
VLAILDGVMGGMAGVLCRPYIENKKAIEKEKEKKKKKKEKRKRDT